MTRPPCIRHTGPTVGAFDLGPAYSPKIDAVFEPGLETTRGRRRRSIELQLGRGWVRHAGLRLSGIHSCCHRREGSICARTELMYFVLRLRPGVVGRASIRSQSGKSGGRISQLRQLPLKICGPHDRNATRFAVTEPPSALVLRETLPSRLEDHALDAARGGRQQAC